jgi:hypothetical protein
MDEVTTILTELAIARVTLRAGLPGQSITIEQAQQLIDKSHERVVTAIALLRGDEARCHHQPLTAGTYHHDQEKKRNATRRP